MESVIDQLCNVEAEAALLGALLIQNDLVGMLVGTLEEGDFSEPVHGRVYAAIADAVANGRKATAILLRPQFENDEALVELGGVAYLARLTADGQGLLAPRELAEQIHELASRRRIRSELVAVTREIGRLDSPLGLIAEAMEATNEVCRNAARGDESKKIQTLDLVALTDVEPKAKRFIVPMLAPAGEVTLFTGPGSAGKSLLVQQLATALAAGVPTLRLDMGKAPAIYLTCEDDAEQLHWRQAHICRALGIRMSSLDGVLHLSSLRGRLDNALGAEGPDGVFRLSRAFDQLADMIRQTGAKLVALDNVSHLFTGNENDRGEVTRFINALNRLAGEAGVAIVLLGHPNKAGDNYSGSTAWLNAVRSQFVIEHDLETDMRTLTVGKANYTRKGEAIRFAWVDWTFVHEDDLPADMVHALADNVKANAENGAFMRCLEACTARRRNVSHQPSSNYAPKIFAGMTEAKGIKQKALAAAMERLLHLGEIELDVELWPGPNRHLKRGIRTTERVK